MKSETKRELYEFFRGVAPWDPESAEDLTRYVESDRWDDVYFLLRRRHLSVKSVIELIERAKVIVVEGRV